MSSNAPIHYVPINLPRLLQVYSVITALEEVHPPSFQFFGETHNFWEIVYIKQGEAQVIADEKDYLLPQGSIIFHKPMEFHRIRSIGGQPHTALILSFQMEGRGVSFFENQILCLREEDRNLLQTIVDLASQVIEQHPSLTHFERRSLTFKAQMISAQLELFLAQLLLYKKNETAFIPLTANNYQNIVHILNENYDKALQIEDIAQLCNLSTSRLKKVFYEHSNKSIMKSFLHIKLRHAISMLDQGKSITWTSEQLAFSSPSYFSYVFKREIGYSPNYYRKYHPHITI